MRDVGDAIVVRVEWGDGDVCRAHIMPRGFSPPHDALHAWDDTRMRHLRHVNERRGPLYLPGTILCVHAPVREGDGPVEYCVHVPELEAHESADGVSKHLLEIGARRWHMHDELYPRGCSRHEEGDMLCRACGGEDGEGTSVMLSLGYVCTIRALEA